jgi:membrane-associated protein
MFGELEQIIQNLVRDYGTGVYAILFAVIFAETGLVVCPWLPGDSLLFALGIFCRPGEHSLNFWALSTLLVAAAFIGDNVNYQVGRLFGEKLFKNENSRFFKKSYLEKTHSFFERYGGKTLVLARFVPIVRTFAPFVAGMGRMEFPRFLAFSFGGALFWVYSCMGAGYMFGQIPAVKENFEIVVLAVIVVSVAPMLLKVRSARKAAKASASE